MQGIHTIIVLSTTNQLTSGNKDVAYCYFYNPQTRSLKPSVTWIPNLKCFSAVTEENVDEAFMALAKSIRMEFDPKIGKLSDFTCGTAWHGEKIWLNSNQVISYQENLRVIETSPENLAYTRTQYQL